MKIVQKFPVMLSLIVLSLGIPSGETLAQTGTGVIAGRVVNETGAPVADVNVSIEGTEIETLTDQTGAYRLTGVPPGAHVITTRRIGFAVVRLPVSVTPNAEIEMNIRLAEASLKLEGITVTADASGRARGELGTATVIGSEAIRHQTATSLAGVLELLPGVELSPPSLSSVQQLPLRSVRTSGIAGGGSSSDLAGFGTLIIVDDVPLSNNANLQSLGPRGELGFATSAGGGIDLRQIPAATIERVEVIRGVPSARYGDLTQGAIVVDTRVGAFETETRIQYDALTVETTAVGGWDLSAKHSLTANIDYARTRTSPGVTQDYANRYAGQLRHAMRLGGEINRGSQTFPKLTLDSRVDFYRLDDDRPENPNTRPGYASRARDAGLRISERARFRFQSGINLTATASMTRVWQRSFARAERSRGAMPFTNTLTAGRTEGWFVLGPYTSELNVDGDPWLLYSRIEAGATSGWFGLIHQLRAGAEFRREWNSGAGYQFDVEFPPQVSFNGVQGYDRPRDFASIPALATSSVYIDDRITGALPLGMSYSLQVGLRVDALHRNGSWLRNARDVVLQPRFSGEVVPAPWLRLRGGWGRTAKTPSLGNLHPADQYNDVINVNWFTNTPDERLAVLTTFIFDPADPTLGFAEAQKSEVGFEIGVGGSVISLVAFRDRIEGGIGYRQDVTSILRDQYQLTDSLTGNGIPPEIIDPPSGADTVPILVQRPSNFLNVESKGFELTATLPEIPRLRTRIQMQGSWITTDWVSDALHVGTARVFNDFQLSSVQRRAPYWEGVRERGQKYLATYRIIHHQPALGLIVTATIQHNLKDLVDDVDSRDTLAFSGYITRDGQVFPVPEADRGLDEYRDLRIPRGGLIDPLATPGDWMMGLQVSKALPLEGELRFWAFNALDRVGRYAEAGTVSRVYRRIQFGVELNLRPGAVTRGWQ